MDSEEARQGSLWREGELELPPPQDKQAAGPGDTGTSLQSTHTGVPLPTGPDTHTSCGPRPAGTSSVPMGAGEPIWGTLIQSFRTCFSAGPQVKGQY